MAKPGRQARAALRGAKDLSRARLTDEQVYEVGAALEMARGFRCNGCGRRITSGFKFTSLAPREEVVAIQLAACSREGCDYGMRCRDDATFMELVEYVWLDGFGPEAPPSKGFLAAQERQAAKKAAASSARESRASEAA